MLLHISLEFIEIKITNNNDVRWREGTGRRKKFQIISENELRKIDATWVIFRWKIAATANRVINEHAIVIVSIKLIKN